MCIRDSIYTIGTREAQYGVSTAAGGSVVGTGVGLAVYFTVFLMLTETGRCV